MVSIIIVNWNGKKWLKDCFDSIYRQTHKDYEIILVDNGSSDDSVKFTRENYSQVKIVRNQKNLGFGKANNLGEKNAKGEILFFLNNDTILENKTLENLLRCKENRNINITGPKTLDFNRNDVYEKRKLTIDFTGYLGWGKETFYVEGCAMMVGKEDFQELGGFDEKYFMYSEDIDLCWRAWLFGMKVGICDEASLIHFGGGSSESTRLRDKRHMVPIFRRYETEKNNLRSLLKNYKIGNLFWILPLSFAQIFCESFLYIITGNFRMFWNIWKSIIWNAANIRSTWQARGAVQKKRKISDQAIFSKINFSLNKPRAFLSVGIPKFK